METLYIDTHNTKNFEIGFKENNIFKTAKGEDASIEILSKIEELTKNSFEKIIICTGPGSLTGLRIGSCFAQGISLAKGIKTYGISIWELILNEYPNIEIYFNTGTKKWIYKTTTEEKIEEIISSSKNLWTSNKPELLNFETKNFIKWPNIIELMNKYESLASNNIDLLYPIDLFKQKL